MFESNQHLKAWMALMDAADQADTDIPCTNYPDAFHPAPSSSGNEAKGLCLACPIKAMCAEYGILFERDGIYGGLSPRSRAATRQQRGLKPLAAERIAETV